MEPLASSAKPWDPGADPARVLKTQRKYGGEKSMNGTDACELVDLEEIMDRINGTDFKSQVVAVRLNEAGDLELDTSFSSSADVPEPIIEVAKNVKGMTAGKRVLILTEDGSTKEVSPG
jgi:hypothetical protein